jgi:predicted dehydrogenase
MLADDEDVATEEGTPPQPEPEVEQPAATVGKLLNLERAKDFVSQWGSDGCTAYNSYDELVANADIDIIYIGTKTKDHCEHSLLAIVRPERVEP